jgi:hypothetical protein
MHISPYNMVHVCAQMDGVEINVYQRYTLVTFHVMDVQMTAKVELMSAQDASRAMFYPQILVVIVFLALQTAKSALVWEVPSVQHASMGSTQKMEKVLKVNV